MTDYPPSDLEQMPPQAVDAEQDVLGVCMQWRHAIPEVADVLAAVDSDPKRVWYHLPHALIWQAILDLWTEEEAVDQLTVGHRLRDREQLDAVGGPVYLAQLTGGAMTAVNVMTHSKLIADKALRRFMLDIGSQIQYSARNGMPTDEAIGTASEALYGLLAPSKGSEGWKPVRQAVQAALRAHADAAANPGRLSGLDTGLADLNDLTAGWQPGTVTLIAGTPGEGKTAASTQFGRHAALHAGVPVGIFHLEMPEVMIGQRLLALMTGINLQRLRRGQAEDEAARMDAAAAAELELPVWFDDTPGITVGQMRARARQLVQREQAGLIIVDYLQLLEPDKATDSSEREVSQISKGLQRMARELDVPVLALSQLSRAPQTRRERRPRLSDLRSSGSLEQDARCVVFVHRPEMHGIEKDSDGNPTAGIAELIVAKQTQGPPGTVRVQWDAHTANFRDLARAPEHEQPTPWYGR